MGKKKEKSKNSRLVGFGERVSSIVLLYIVLFDGGAILFYDLSLAELF
jgi:hypothetical protein